MKTEIVVIAGGITGVTATAILDLAVRRVALVEVPRLGLGDTDQGTGSTISLCVDGGGDGRLHGSSAAPTPVEGRIRWGYPVPIPCPSKFRRATGTPCAPS